MATLPTFEKILLEIHQSLGIKQSQTSNKKRFSDYLYSLETHKEKFKALLDEIYKEIEIEHLDKTAPKDLYMSLIDMARSYTEIYSKTYTFNANKQNIIWHLLGFVFAPSLGRRIAFWNFPQLDKGMPRGRFWYLPDRYGSKKDGEVYLPIPQVMDWFFDISGLSHREFAEQYDQKFNKNTSDSIVRMFNKWDNGVTPDVNTIKEYFRDDFTFEIRGHFEVDERLPLDQRFDLALDFLKQKKLSKEEIRNEILMDVPSITADNFTKKYFVELIRERYQKPTNRIIRRRFLIARMFQDGYIRLLKFLFPNVDVKSNQPDINKLLQIIDIYQVVYNLTVEANVEVGDGSKKSQHIENDYFEKILLSNPLNTFDALTLFTAIRPSAVYKNTACSETAEALTIYFEDADNNKLPNLFGFINESGIENEEVFKEILDYKMKLVSFYDNLHKGVSKFEKSLKLKRLNCLKEENDFEVVKSLYQKSNNTLLKKEILKHLEEIACTSRHRLYVIGFKLDEILNSSLRNKDTKHYVEDLIKDAKSNEEYDLWDAVFLQYEAKHLLYQNKFDKALELFEKALEATRKRQFGGLQAEIARDCLATSASIKGIDKKKQEKFYRIAINGGILEYFEDEKEYSLLITKEMTSFDIFAQWCCTYFLESLYKPYH